jgi:hypothetical protein
VKVITFLIGERDGNQLASLETTDAHEADTTIERVRVWHPDAMVTRSEREDGS